MFDGIFETNNWVWLIITGGIAGVLAKAVMPGKDPGGIIVTILLGIAGGLLMGTLGKFLNLGDGVGIPLAIVGAVILLALYRLINKNRNSGPPSV
jgi:uncharacterized membrane protein YeaQ/YmgE (transglycosylase-associated protein family)